MWKNKGKKKLAMEKNIKYISSSSLAQYEGQPNTFFAQRLVKDAMERDVAGLAALVGTQFDIEIKRELLRLGVPISADVTQEDIEKSNNREHKDYEEALKRGAEVTKQYKRSRLHLNPLSLPIPRKWKQVEGRTLFTIDGVPILALLDAVIQDHITGDLVPLDWKVIGGGAKTGVSPRKGFADVCISGAWQNKPHKYYTECEAKSPDSGYKGVDIRIEDIDKKFATQFCIYGWALQHEQGLHPSRLNFSPFPVHFDSGVFNGKDRQVKIYTYRAICSVEWQEHVLDRLQAMWKDLSLGGNNLINRLHDRYQLENVKGAAKDESWF